MANCKQSSEDTYSLLDTRPFGAYQYHRNVVGASRLHRLRKQCAHCVLVARGQRALDLAVADHVCQAIAAQEPARGEHQIVRADMRRNWKKDGRAAERLSY